MTPKEIKKIAEEYAEELFPEDYSLMQKGECDFETEEVIKGCISAFECHARYLLERYYLVEKGKVEEEYEAAKWHKETAESMNIQYGKGMAKGQLITLENLFGPDFRKEEE